MGARQLVIGYTQAGTKCTQLFFIQKPVQPLLQHRPLSLFARRFWQHDIFFNLVDRAYCNSYRLRGKLHDLNLSYPFLKLIQPHLAPADGGLFIAPGVEVVLGRCAPEVQARASLDQFVTLIPERDYRAFALVEHQPELRTL